MYEIPTYIDKEYLESTDLKQKVICSNLKQKVKDDRKRITALPVICSDPNFKFPLPIISKLLGTKWEGGYFEEKTFGDVKVKRKNFGDYQEKIT